MEKFAKTKIDNSTQHNLCHSKYYKKKHDHHKIHDFFFLFLFILFFFNHSY